MTQLKALGNHIYNQFINSKSIEWDYYRTQVSEWERSIYETILIAKQKGKDLVVQGVKASCLSFFCVGKAKFT